MFADNSVAIIRRRARGTDRRLPAEQGQASRSPCWKPTPTTSAASARTAQVQGLPLRHRRPPLLLQVQGSRRPLDRAAARRHARPAALVAHLLQRQVLLLPAQGRRGPAQARRLRIGALRAVVREGAHVPDQEPEELRGLGHATSSASACSTSSSRPTRKRSGA